MTARKLQSDSIEEEVPGAILYLDDVEEIVQILRDAAAPAEAPEHYPDPAKPPLLSREAPPQPERPSIPKGEIDWSNPAPALALNEAWSLWNEYSKARDKYAMEVERVESQRRRAQERADASARRRTPKITADGYELDTTADFVSVGLSAFHDVLIRLDEPNIRVSMSKWGLRAHSDAVSQSTRGALGMVRKVGERRRSRRWRFLGSYTRSLLTSFALAVTLSAACVLLRLRTLAQVSSMFSIVFVLVLLMTLVFEIYFPSGRAIVYPYDSRRRGR